jgi:hypothetical protein
MTSQLCTVLLARFHEEANELTSICLEYGSDGTFIRMCKFDRHRHLHNQLIIKLLDYTAYSNTTS